MKRLIPFILFLSILLSGCGAAAPAADATATISAEDIRATADSMVYGMLTQTAAAMPTNTPVPPTETPLPPPTATLMPTLDSLAEVPTATAAAALVIPTNTRASASSYACTEQPLLTWTGDSVQLSVTNNVKNTTANVYLCIVTPYGEAGYISVSAGSSVQVPYGAYSATAWVDGKKSFNATTGFVIKSPGNVQLVIDEGRIDLRAGCAPGC